MACWQKCYEVPTIGAAAVTPDNMEATVLEKIVGLRTTRKVVRTEAPARSYLVSQGNGVLRRKVQTILHHTIMFAFFSSWHTLLDDAPHGFQDMYLRDEQRNHDLSFYPDDITTIS